MRDEERQGSRARQADAAPTEVVETRVTSGTVRLRRGTAQAFSWTRLGVVLAIVLLLGAAAFIARTPLAGDASASDVPDPSPSHVTASSVAPSSVAASSVAPSPLESPASPEPTPTTRMDESPAPTDVVEPSEQPSEGPEWTPRIWSFDPDARFEASVVLTESCLLDQDGWEVPHAQVIFQVTWDGEVPLALIDNRTDGGSEGGYGGDIEVSGTYGMGIIATTAEPHVLTMRFYADTEEVGPGTIVKEIDTPFEIDPSNACSE